MSVTVCVSVSVSLSMSLCVSVLLHLYLSVSYLSSSLLVFSEVVVLPHLVGVVVLNAQVHNDAVHSRDDVTKRGPPKGKRENECVYVSALFMWQRLILCLLLSSLVFIGCCVFTFHSVAYVSFVSLSLSLSHCSSPSLFHLSLCLCPLSSLCLFALFSYIVAFLSQHAISSAAKFG